MYRRTFLSTALLAPLGAAPPSGEVTLSLHPERTLARIPADYTGLSYETSQLAEPNIFSASNTSLVALFRLLSPQGVLRLGGNSSDFCWWKTFRIGRGAGDAATCRTRGAELDAPRPHRDYA